MSVKKQIVWSMILALALLPACEARQQREKGTPLRQERPGYLVAVALDLSGSFANLMLGGEGKAWKFFMAVASRLAHDRAGEDDRIVIAQISGNARALLWEGSPASLRRDFPSAAAFRDFLRQRSDPGASRVHDSCADLVEYVSSQPGVQDGSTKSAVFILSDMEDNWPGPEKSQERFVTALRRYAGQKGVVGIFWCDHRFAGGWKRSLADAGLRSWVVESDIVSQPTLPTFDD